MAQEAILNMDTLNHLVEGNKICIFNLHLYMLFAILVYIRISLLLFCLEISDYSDQEDDPHSQDSNSSDSEMETDSQEQPSTQCSNTESEKRVFRIPKRRRVSSPQSFQFQSPLNRIHPAPSQSASYNKRPCIDAGKHREPCRRQWERSSKSDRLSSTRRIPSLRTNDAILRRSLLKMRIPEKMLRPSGRYPFEDFLKPSTESCSRFICTVPLEHKIKPEKYTDNLVKRCIEWAMHSSRLQDKSIPVDSIGNHFHNLQCFTQNSINKEAWNVLRKGTILSGDLVTLTAFADEMLMWLQLNMDYGADWKLCRDDIIMSAAPDLCNQILFKVKTMIKCFLPTHYQQTLVRQLCYLICSGDRLKDAANLLQELVMDFQMGMYVTYVMTPYAFLYSQTVPGCTFGPYFTKCLKQYEPGMAMGLLNSIIKNHYDECTSKTCSNNTTCTLGSGVENRGLFFFPLVKRK